MLLLLLSACFTQRAATCSRTCERIYDECGIQRPGRTQDELIDTCFQECNQAMGTRGELGAYDPYERTSADRAMELQNREQAQIWAQCVEETACEQLDDGYCAPIW